MAEQYQVYICSICDYRYDEAAGDADFNIAAGTPFAAFADEWRCPECGCFKENFVFTQK